MTETHEQRFERIATNRAEKVAHVLGLMQNLGRSPYKSTPERRREILAGLQGDLDALAEAWGVETAPAQPEPVQMPDKLYLTPSPQPAGMPRAPIDGEDRRTIRAAMHRIWDGDAKGGLASIAAVMRGWAPEPE